MIGARRREAKRGTHHSCLYLLFTLEVKSKWILLQLKPVFSFFAKASRPPAQLMHSCKSSLSLLVLYRISKALQRIPRNRWILFLMYTYSIFTDAVTGGWGGGALCAEPWIIKIDPFVMLACIKLRYAMRLPLAAAAVNPCHVSLHLAAWAYLMFCQSLWCSCQEHSCSNSPASLSLWQLLQKLYFPTNFLMPLALGFSRIISILYAFNAAQCLFIERPSLVRMFRWMRVVEVVCVLRRLPLSGVPLCLWEFRYGCDIGRNWTSPSDRGVLWCLTEAWQQLHQVRLWLPVCLSDARSCRNNTLIEDQKHTFCHLSVSFLQEYLFRKVF